MRLLAGALGLLLLLSFGCSKKTDKEPTPQTVQSFKKRFERDVPKPQEEKKMP